MIGEQNGCAFDSCENCQENDLTLHQKKDKKNKKGTRKYKHSKLVMRTDQPKGYWLLNDFANSFNQL